MIYSSHYSNGAHGPQVYILCKMYVCLHAELAERAWNAFELMKWRQQQGLSVVHCSHIFPPQQPNMWKKLTWARARRAARPTIAVIFFFQFSTPCSAVWENYAPADMINSWVDRSSWGSAYTHFIYCTYVDVHFFSSDLWMNKTTFLDKKGVCIWFGNTVVCKLVGRGYFRLVTSLIILANLWFFFFFFFEKKRSKWLTQKKVIFLFWELTRIEKK